MQDLSSGWRYEEQDGETVVVKGEQVLKIEEEIDYDCTVDEKGTEVAESYTSREQ